MWTNSYAQHDHQIIFVIYFKMPLIIGGTPK